jgi:hypothetical protein
MNFARKDSVDTDLNDELSLVEKVQLEKFGKLSELSKLSSDRIKKGPAFISAQNIVAECQAVNKKIGELTTISKPIKIVQMPAECRELIKRDSKANLKTNQRITKDIALACLDGTNADKQIFLFERLVEHPLLSTNHEVERGHASAAQAFLEQLAQHCMMDLSDKLAQTIGPDVDVAGFEKIFEEVFSSGN